MSGKEQLQTHFPGNQHSSAAHHPSGSSPQHAGSSVDFYAICDLLTEEERLLRENVRAFGQREILPIINAYWEKGEFPFELLPRLATLNLTGCTIQGYGCPGLSQTAAGVIFAELARCDGSINAFLGINTLVMYSIALFGSEEQKNRWLPPLAKLEKVGAFGLTEPDHGSDVIHLETHARRDGNDWVLNGSKRWIGNASFADVVVVWARTNTGQVNGFLVEKGTPGFRAEVMKEKTTWRAVWQTDITCENARIPASHRLAKTQNFHDLMQVLLFGRYRIAWSAVGHAMACYEYALAYTKKRKQFGKPLAGFQLVQQKLARMLAEITSMQTLCLRLGQLMDEGKATTAMVSLAKMQTTLKARQVAADARDLLGGNGVLLEYHVSRHQADLEALFTAEGADHMQALTVGLDITGLQAFF